MFLFLDLKVFVSWIFVSVDLHISYVSLFWCYRNSDSLQKAQNIYCNSLKQIFNDKPDQLQQSLGREVIEMHGILQQQHQQKQLPLMRHQQMPM